MTDTTHGTSRFDGGFLAAGDAIPCLAALAVRVLNSLIEEVTLSRTLDECDFSGEQGRGRALKGKTPKEGVPEARKDLERPPEAAEGRPPASGGAWGRSPKRRPSRRIYRGTGGGDEAAAEQREIEHVMYRGFPTGSLSGSSR